MEVTVFLSDEPRFYNLYLSKTDGMVVVVVVIITSSNCSVKLRGTSYPSIKVHGLSYCTKTGWMIVVRYLSDVCTSAMFLRLVVRVHV